MAVKLSVGLSRKQGLPDYGSVGASCHLEIELASDILSGAGTPLQRQAEIALDACRQVVYTELERHGRTDDEESAALFDRDSRPQELPVRESYEAPLVRTATPKQLRAIERLVLKLGISPCDFYHERLGTTPPHALSVAEASHLIDELQNMTHSDRQLTG